MGQVVLKVSMNEIMKMKQYYETNVTGKTPPGGVFSAKTPSCGLRL